MSEIKLCRWMVNMRVCLGDNFTDFYPTHNVLKVSGPNCILAFVPNRACDC